jgi:EmrB/QacA subfamily drug resistance transporter
MIKESSEKAARAWVLALTSLAASMISLDSQVVATALSTIRLHLGASIEELEWTVNDYALSFAVLLMTGAALGDRFGRRRLFVTGLLLFVLASAACALAPNVGWLIAARALQGCGSALVMPLGLTLLSAAFPAKRWARALGIFTSVTGLALLVGPVVGGAIAGSLAWQWIFWINVPIGLILILLVLNRIQESFGPRAVLDIAGLALVTGAALGLVWGLVRGNCAGWGSFEVVAALVAGVVLAVAFVAWELRARVPMIPMRFFRSRAFSAGNTANFLLMAAIYGTLFFLAQFLQTAQGYGPLTAGLHLLPWTACLFVVAPISGTLVNRVGERPLIVGGLLLQTIGLAWIGLIASTDLAYAWFLAPLIIAGVGGALAMPAAQNVVVSSVATSEIGKASGTFSMLRQLGGAFGVAILAAVFASVGGYRSAQAFSNGFAAALIAAAALSLIGAIAGMALPSRRARTVVQTQAKAPEIREIRASRILPQTGDQEAQS